MNDNLGDEKVYTHNQVFRLSANSEIKTQFMSNND